MDSSMNLSVVLIAVVFVVLATVFVYAALSHKKKVQQASGEAQGSGSKPEAEYAYHYSVFIEGMSCGHCKARIEEAFKALGGCSAVVNLEEKCAAVSSAEPLAEEALKKVVEETGFTFVSCR